MEKRLTLVCLQRSESAANWLCHGAHEKAGQSGRSPGRAKPVASRCQGTGTEREQLLGASLDDVLPSGLTKIAFSHSPCEAVED